MRKSAGIIRVPVGGKTVASVQIPHGVDGSRADSGTLVDELVEGVLPVGPGLPPHDGSSVVPDPASIFGDVLPVGFHVALTTTETARLQAARQRRRRRESWGRV